MLIVSKIHDYYDTAATYGIDKTVVYKRTEVDVDIKGERWPYTEKFQDKNNDILVVNKFAIGFCGKIYPLVVVDVNGDPYDRYCFYDKQKLIDFMNAREVKEDRKYSYWSFRDFSIRTQRGMDAFFDSITWTDLLVNFVKYNSPLFVYGRMGFGDNSKLELHVNRTLKEFEFFKVKDSHTAFQDVYMFISGVLGQPEKKSKPISDKIKAASKGHDGEYSFRKPPGKRGKKQWR